MYFRKDGVVALVDGQFGSTGKGLAASYFAQKWGKLFGVATSNAGPNSGHTAYEGDRKIVLKQLPTFAVVAFANLHHRMRIVLNGGAIIDRALLNAEVREWFGYGHSVQVHPHAAEILPRHREAAKETVRAIASTGMGVGEALADKVLRQNFDVMMGGPGNNDMFDVLVTGYPWYGEEERIWMEVSQGFSLGVNQGFWPRCTSRECTVAQGLADAGLSPKKLDKTIMVCRTYPIRVGNTENSSGGCYGDQREMSWDELGVEPEFTTVTKRQRRIFTWSRLQFRLALQANRPEILFLNFMNYLLEGTRQDFLMSVISDYMDVMKAYPEGIFLGYGPRTDDVVCFYSTPDMPGVETSGRRA